MKQKTIKVIPRVHALAERLSKRFDMSMATLVDLTLRQIEAGNIVIAPEIGEDGRVIKRKAGRK